MESNLAYNIVAVIGYFIYNYLAYKFIDSLLSKARNKYATLFFTIVNTLIMAFLYLYVTKLPVVVFGVTYILYYVEVLLIYNDKSQKSYFTASALLIHIMVLTSVLMAVFSLILNKGIGEIMYKAEYMSIIWILVWIVLSLVTLLVLKTIPANKVRIVFDHKSQLNYLTILITLFNFFLFTKAFTMPPTDAYSSVYFGQIISSLVIISAFYIFLFYTFKTSQMLNYKEINEQLQHKIINEQQLRNSITGHTLACYEYNASNNTAISGFEDFYKKVGERIEDVRVINRIIGKDIVHPEDYKEFLEYTDTHKAITNFNSGINEYSVEYRRKSAEGKYIWAKSHTTMVKDTATEDIICYTYVKDIDEEKRIQSELKFKAERDSLTGLYNQGTSKRLIQEFLKEEYEQDTIAAIFIVDIDNFKQINDLLGHTYGDAVLSELSVKLSSVFRSNDIVGRIGGDEFVALLKNVRSVDLVKTKAQKICDEFKNSYNIGNNLEQKVSASVGIALFPQHGRDWETLYINADSALYKLKNQGKNAYGIFNREEFERHESKRTKIDAIGSLPQKSFKLNRIEYVFKILFSSENPMLSIESVLKLITSHFNFSRGYIFEMTADRQNISNTYEWCAEGIEAQKDSLQNLPISALKDAIEKLNSTGMYILQNMAGIQKEGRDILEPQGIKSMLQFAMFENGTLHGCIGFDDCVKERIPTEEEIDEISTMCNILTIFIVKQRALEKAKLSGDTLKAMLDNLDTYAYVVDKATFNLIYANKKTLKDCDKNAIGMKCYTAIKKKEEPCEDCILNMLEGDKDYVEDERYIEPLNKWLRLNAVRIDEENGNANCLISCTDITKYIEK